MKYTPNLSSEPCNFHCTLYTRILCYLVILQIFYLFLALISTGFQWMNILALSFLFLYIRMKTKYVHSSDYVRHRYFCLLNIVFIFQFNYPPVFIFPIFFLVLKSFFSKQLVIVRLFSQKYCFNRGKITYLYTFIHLFIFFCILVIKNIVHI